jgi:hypothetical protein
MSVRISFNSSISAQFRRSAARRRLRPGPPAPAALCPRAASRRRLPEPRAPELAPESSMASRAGAPAPRQSATADKGGEVNVQVLLRCRCGAGASDGARRAQELGRPSPLPCAPADAPLRQRRHRRPQNAEEIKQRIPQAIKCNDALREARPGGADKKRQPAGLKADAPRPPRRAGCCVAEHRRQAAGPHLHL